MKIMNGLDLQSQKITNLADPSASTDAVNLQYVQNFLRGISWKEPVRVASTASITLAVPGASIDGVALTAGDRVLLKNQAAPAENGIWVWTGAAAALTRATDADTGTELQPGTAVTVTEGTVGADLVYHIISDDPITIGTTDQAWSQLGGGGGGTTYTAGNGIDLAGDAITVVAESGKGVTVGSGGLAVDPTIVPLKYSANIGNGALTSIAVAHNLGTKDVVVSLRKNSDDAGFITDWVATDTNTVTLTFAVAPASNEHRVTVIG